MSPNLLAFLNLLMWAEGTLSSPDPSRVVFGKKTTLKDLSNHPAITGEWKGEVLAPKYCLNLGLKPGCKSTAAGAFQIIKPTWMRLQAKHPMLLPDFSFASQKRAASLLLVECGAFPLIEKGEISSAIFRASRLWASLPHSTSGQPQRTLAKCMEKFSLFLSSEKK